MGYMNHHAILASTTNSKLFDEILDRIYEIPSEGYDPQVIMGFPTKVNGMRTLVIIPDGSFEGRDESDYGDSFRDSVIRILESYRDSDNGVPITWCEMQYGDENEVTSGVDDSGNKMLRHSYKPYEESAEYEALGKAGNEKYGGAIYAL